MGRQDFDPELVRGLTALAASAFPKRCRNCGRTFVDVADYVRQTEAMPDGSAGLKQSFDEEGRPIVDFFRNCPCGSTLMDSFNDRRDLSPQGEARRQRFGELLDYLASRGIERAIARRELLKVMRGEKSELLAQLPPPGRETVHA